MRIHREIDGACSRIIELRVGFYGVNRARLAVHGVNINVDNPFIGELFPETIAALIKSNTVGFLPVGVTCPGIVPVVGSRDRNRAGIGDRAERIGKGYAFNIVAVIFHRNFDGSGVVDGSASSNVKPHGYAMRASVAA